MEIRKKLVLRFTILVGIILIVAEVSIYLFAVIFWKDDFYNRLVNKANSSARLFVDVEGVDSTLLHQMETNNPFSVPMEEVAIFDFRGKLLFSSKDTGRLQFTSRMIDLVKITKLQKFHQGMHSVSGIYYPGKYDRIIVFAAGVDVYGQRKLVILRYILMGVLVISLIVVFVFGRYYSNRALQPMLDVVAQVPAINEQNLHLRVDEGNGRDEIARLARTFNQMLDRLEGAFKLERTFIAFASHQLRTPLTYISGKMEVTLLKERSVTEYKDTLNELLSDMHNLNVTANRLLMLAISIKDDPFIQKEPIWFDEILWNARSQVLREISGSQINIRFASLNEGTEGWTISGNENLLRVALINLFENGCKYSHNRTVDVLIGLVGREIRVTISDTGIGIPAEDLELVFEPFFRGKNSAQYKGTGLGLSLVKNIIRIHEGTIVLASEVNKGTTITLTLPIISV